MTFFLRLSSIVSVVLVCLYQRVDGATSYDQRGKEVIAIVQGKKASWVVRKFVLSCYTFKMEFMRLVLHQKDISVFEQNILYNLSLYRMFS